MTDEEIANDKAAKAAADFLTVVHDGDFSED